MSRKGGYIILDLKNVNLIPNEFVTTDISMEKLTQITFNTRKNVLITGININGNKLNDVFIKYTQDSFSIYGYEVEAKWDTITGNLQIKLVEN